MKANNVKDLWKMSDGDLQKEISACQENLLKLRFKKEVEDVVATSVIRSTKRKIAQAKTILHLRQIKQNTSEQK